MKTVLPFLLVTLVSGCERSSKEVNMEQTQCKESPSHSCSSTKSQSGGKPDSGMDSSGKKSTDDSSYPVTPSDSSNRTHTPSDNSNLPSTPSDSSNYPSTPSNGSNYPSTPSDGSNYPSTPSNGSNYPSTPSDQRNYPNVPGDNTTGSSNQGSPSLLPSDTQWNGIGMQDVSLPLQARLSSDGTLKLITSDGMNPKPTDISWAAEDTQTNQTDSAFGTGSSSVVIGRVTVSVAFQFSTGNQNCISRGRVILGGDAAPLQSRCKR